jgi:iron complex transport system substrate-binding protein
MNRKSARRHWVKIGCAAFAVASLQLALPHPWLPAHAEAPRRIVSINLCTDQLALALAEPERIVALGRFARRTDMSFMAEAARGIPQVRGSAEEVLRLRPDLVLAGAFSGRATRAALVTHGIQVETFAPPRSITEARAEIVRAGELIGAQQKAAALLAEIGKAVAEATTAAHGQVRRTALPLQRRGFASGRDTLVSSALEIAGLTNAADTLSIGSIARAPLEAIVKLKPDVLVVEGMGPAADQATALLHHPVLQRGLAARIITLPTAEVTCGGPSVAALIARMAGEGRRVR